MPNESIKKTLNDLAHAINNKQVEPICVAFQELRQASGQIPFAEMMSMAKKYIGKPLQPMIVSSYSRRPCFMCNKGVAVCIKCDGTGKRMDDSFCKSCKGLGLTACGFCRGTGWAERETIPPELLKAVLKNQLEHLEKDVGKLREKLGTGNSDELKELSKKPKRKLKTWLIRINARIMDLIDSEAADDDSDREKNLSALASRIQKVLTIIR